MNTKMTRERYDEIGMANIKFLHDALDFSGDKCEMEDGSLDTTLACELYGNHLIELFSNDEISGEELDRLFGNVEDGEMEEFERLTHIDMALEEVCETYEEYEEKLNKLFGKVK